MGRSQYPSTVTMPADNAGCATVLAFLIKKFPRIPEDVWCQRVAQGNVHWDDLQPVTACCAYAPKKRVFYYREVAEEPVIPFSEEIIYQDDELLVACKPHFLPVTPAGIYVRECLLNRLREKTGIDSLAPIHRIDRETAGLVLFSVNPETRADYHPLFANGQVKKTYLAIAPVPEQEDIAGRDWLIENRIVEAEQWFRMTAAEGEFAGEVNARSMVRCLKVKGDRGLFQLSPITGKTHQLRVHMSGLGYPLLNDRLYPMLQPKSADNYDTPLQLLAHRLYFTDPLTGKERQFVSTRTLNW